MILHQRRTVPTPVFPLVQYCPPMLPMSHASPHSARSAPGFHPHGRMRIAGLNATARRARPEPRRRCVRRSRRRSVHAHGFRVCTNGRVAHGYALPDNARVLRESLSTGLCRLCVSLLLHSE
jgi:hypothetical protein